MNGRWGGVWCCGQLSRERQINESRRRNTESIPPCRCSHLYFIFLLWLLPTSRWRDKNTVRVVVVVLFTVVGEEYISILAFHAVGVLEEIIVAYFRALLLFSLSLSLGPSVRLASRIEATWNQSIKLRVPVFRMRSQRRTETKDVLLQRATSSLFVSREITDRKRERKRSVRLMTSISSYVFNHNLFLSPRSCLLFFLSPKQIRRRFAVLLHRQSKVVAQLQGHVVAGDPPLLSQHARLARRLQERSAFHVLRRDLLVLFQGSQPVYAVRRTITFSFWPTSLHPSSRRKPISHSSVW